MSGHSHAKTVAATKNANDAKKGKIFSKMGRVITIAVKEKGADVTSNIQLKALIEKAREFNMPNENIQRAIKKGTGELVGEDLQEVSFEGFGPGGIALIIEGITDNKNRTLGEIKGILGQYEGKMAGEGAVRWMFERRGVIVADPSTGSTGSPQAGSGQENLEETAIEAGADDIRENIVYTKPEDLEAVKKSLEQKGIKTESGSLDWVPKEEVMISDKDKEKSEKLFEMLDDNDAVQNIYSNLKV
ncbi:MAG: transcriptional regulator [Candidatus Staskawiczbacteria bacterium RIFCSPHIGHO2_02_FULL_43_16]|uniref:Probable transcriptional regulatory protein A2822_02115 n=1 Tax=Candidatus Staskawiczbacteria bacterium RIFCSPHIGHO2_01_FULL_41_41 TaxID=1802203 RepID=A0A1G2HVS1_9BACT|nr:MAG: transcriptional regulator [Candidatus Staskawiczbacteria bacterium RIFCSPHIGHO2_01_FULL_41_41]OGZ68954.1 MAG: transcriptional regulator [Candidatus Staskawiczbacteria bacterium RIFCSPHIGHO2_02_FULL_43_16]OGZ74864.1 MAG: transcriptional regulator [Candidatus Staskawiczbacteria bacterium RIFCSPLOWO2_01_FULL_43_17b]